MTISHSCATYISYLCVSGSRSGGGCATRLNLPSQRKSEPRTKALVLVHTYTPCSKPKPLFLGPSRHILSKACTRLTWSHLTAPDGNSRSQAQPLPTHSPAAHRSHSTPHGQSTMAWSQRPGQTAQPQICAARCTSVVCARHIPSVNVLQCTHMSSATASCTGNVLVVVGSLPVGAKTWLACTGAS